MTKPETSSFESRNKWLSSDEHFNNLYPLPIKQLADRHWTSLAIVRKVARFLAPSPDARVLDIGSGVGKFCIAAACHRPAAHFFGIEQRKDLVEHANIAGSILQMENVTFMHGNFTSLDFSEFDHFYFFNSFYEHLTDTEKIDTNISFSSSLYNYYNRQLYKKLNNMPAGTRIATFHSLENELPPEYCLSESHAGTLLKFWVKS